MHRKNVKNVKLMQRGKKGLRAKCILIADEEAFL
jgi:hypothetical protein